MDRNSKKSSFKKTPSVSSGYSVRTVGVDDYSFGFLPYDKTIGQVKFDSNNIFDEIKEIKDKSKIRRIDFVASMTVSDEEYSVALDEVMKVIENITDYTISEIVSVEKPIFMMKQIMEIYCILIGEPLFSWNIFKDRFNLHEVRYKMQNFNVDSLEKSAVNYVMNKISCNTQYTVTNLEKEEMKPFALFYKWAFNTIKIFAYRLRFRQSKKPFKPMQKRTANTGDLAITNNFGKETELPFVDSTSERKVVMKNTYLTAINEVSQVRESKACNTEVVKRKLHSNELKLPDRMDYSLMQANKNLMSLADIPFMKNKNFLSLRRAYGQARKEDETFNYRHFEEIHKASLSNPINVGKVIDKMSKGKFKYLPDGAVKSFNDNLECNDFFFA